MTKRTDSELRNRAEVEIALRQRSKPVATDLAANELEVHRVELELQNESLRGAREALEAALTRYTEVFDLAPIGYAVLDADRQICEINHAGATLLGAERARLAGKRFAAYVADGSLPPFNALLTAAALAPASVQAEIDLACDQRSFPVRITAAPLRRRDASVMLTFEDITRSRREAAELARSENALREANQRKDEFISMLSHELRNPLAPIPICVSTLREVEPGSEPGVRMLDTIERSVDQLSQLINDLLDVSRITSGKVELHRVPIELNGLISRALVDYRLGIEYSGLSLDTQLAGGELWTTGDPVRLVQIISNLLTNAQKFTPVGGRITVAVEEVPGRRALVRVRDSGVGIDPAKIASLFEPFVQAAQGLDRSRGGLGLGLAVARGLVELHGGHIAMRSDGPGRGAEVSFDLPLELRPTGADAAAVAPAGAFRRVLIIEDQRDSADSLELLLSMHGHSVVTAGDGAAGLALAKTFRPDVVLCDLGLPVMDGFAVARAIRADPGLSGRYLVAISGYARPDDIARSRSAGFDTHLAKPVTLARLQAVLASARAVPE